MLTVILMLLLWLCAVAAAERGAGVSGGQTGSRSCSYTFLVPQQKLTGALCLSTAASERTEAAELMAELRRQQEQLRQLQAQLERQGELASEVRALRKDSGAINGRMAQLYAQLLQELLARREQEGQQRRLQDMLLNATAQVRANAAAQRSHLTCAPVCLLTLGPSLSGAAGLHPLQGAGEEVRRPHFLLERSEPPHRSPGEAVSEPELRPRRGSQLPFLATRPSGLPADALSSSEQALSGPPPPPPPPQATAHTLLRHHQQRDGSPTYALTPPLSPPPPQQDKAFHVLPTAATSSPTQPATTSFPITETPATQDTGPWQDCQHVLESGHSSSGIYLLRPQSANRLLQAWCEQDQPPGGWTLIQRRRDGSVNFFRTWEQYKQGFGNLDGEYWLGLEHLYWLTQQKQYRLRVVLEDWQGRTVFADYDTFGVEAESQAYRLRLGRYSGTAGDSLSWHADRAFTTLDRDWDGHTGNCAHYQKGGWWYHACAHSNLNGVWYRGGHYRSRYQDGLYWAQFHGGSYSLRRVAMMIRPT